MTKLEVNYPMKTARIYAFGDSLVAGTYDSRGGWCDRLKQDMHRITVTAKDGTKRQLYNLGIGGETSRGLARRIESELAARHRPEWPAIVLIGIGKNDSRLTAGEPAVPLDEYAQNITHIAQAAQVITDRVAFMGIGLCAKAEVRFKDFTYSRELLFQYEQTLDQVVRRLGIRKIDVYQQLLAVTESIFFRDGIHLNDMGYDMLYNLVKPVLMEMLEG